MSESKTRQAERLLAFQLRVGIAGSFLTRFYNGFVSREAGECWNWGRSCNSKGYGATSIKGVLMSTHRVALMIKLGGLIPDGILACHTCDNPICGNPDHLFSGTSFDNSQDMIRKGRKAVIRGESHANAVASDLQTARIFLEAHAGVCQVDIAKRFGVSAEFVSGVTRGHQRRRLTSALKRLLSGDAA